MDHLHSEQVGASSGPGSVTQLLHRLEQGDADAATDLWMRYGPQIIARARMLLDQFGIRVPDVESVAQQVFIEFCNKRPALANRNKFLGWLLNGARLRAIDQLRREKRTKEVGESRLGHVVDSDGVAGMAAVAADQLTPPEEAERSERLEKLAQAIETLDDDLRRACLLYFNIDNSHGVCESYQDVGDRLGVTREAARLRVLKALRLLKQDLLSRGIDPK